MEKNQCGATPRKGKLLRMSLIVLASVMLLCGTYMATYAFLNKETQEVVNTFSHPTALAQEFKLLNKDTVDSDGNGIYDNNVGSATVAQETYLFVPGVTLTTEVQVSITNLKEDAYLFVEYTAGSATEGGNLLTWNFDGKDNTSYWSFVPNTENRLIYVYVGPQKATASGILAYGKSYTIDVVKNDSVKVSHEIYDIRNENANKQYTLEFNAYLVQSVGFANPEAAWAAAAPKFGN